MKTFLASLLLITPLLLFFSTSIAQDEPVRVVWQVTSFDISANLRNVLLMQLQLSMLRIWTGSGIDLSSAS